MSMTNSTRFTRRGLLKGATAVGALGLASPAIVRNAFGQSSGELNFLGWAGYEFQPVFDAFTAKTGITVNFTGIGSQDEMLAQARTGAATNGDFDIAEPTTDRLTGWTDQNFLQAWNEANINVAGVEPAFLEGSSGDMIRPDGQLFASPTVWGTESLAFNRDEAPLEYGTASLGDLFDDKYAGMLTIRGHSGLAAAGRWLDSQGELPHPFIEGYTDEAKMTAIWDKVVEFAISKRANVAQFWTNENEAQGAFRTNGCVIGLNWDTTAAGLEREGLPIGYIAPKEGAFAWAQGLSLLSGATNVAQAEAFAAFINSPEGGALYAQAWGANSMAIGAVDQMGPESAAFFAAAYPDDALAKLWWWPDQAAWFVAKRTEYAERFMSA
jgi:spermidine/putrescine transport system substrate-binding protein